MTHANQEVGTGGSQDGTKCQVCYNTNYIKYSVQLDLEDPERWWAHINPVAQSTCEMTDGAQYDLIVEDI